MPRQWIGVYVTTDEEARDLLTALGQLRDVIPTLDWDVDFEQDEELDEEAEEPIEGIYQAGFTLHGQPVTTIEEARRIAALAGDVVLDSAEDADNGIWLISIDLHRERKLQTEGFTAWESNDSDDPWAITVEMP